MAIEINIFVLISWMLRLKNVENNCKWVQNHTLRPPPTINNYYIILYSFLLLFYNVNKRKISTLFFPHWTNRGLNVCYLLTITKMHHIFWSFYCRTRHLLNYIQKKTWNELKLYTQSTIKQWSISVTQPNQ